VNAKPIEDNRWWVENSTKRPKSVTAPKEPNANAPAGAKFYAVASDYNQQQAKEHLTDINLRLARLVNPPFGEWAYVAMTQEHCPERVLKSVKRELTLPKQARGIIIDHGHVTRLLICGPQLEDWMIDVRLSAEPSADVYVWGTLHRERLFRRSRDALKQAQRWAQSLISYPPARHDVMRGDLL